MARDDLPPPRHLFYWEGISVFGRFWRAFGRLGERGPAHGRRLMVIPGFFASDRSTLGLQRALARAGYRVTGWGMGVNRGAHAHILDEIIARLEQFSGGQPVVLVGWSLGGIFAREVAKLRPDLAAIVFTMGSPFAGDPRANHAWQLYERVAGHAVDDPPIPVDRGTKPPVPTIALWSRRDGMVAPASARGDERQSDERIEIDSSHMGFATGGRGIRQVVKVIAERAPPV
ncbi:MAG: lipase family alpha/beta hydrolase [Sphingomonadales bacterium]